VHSAHDGASSQAAPSCFSLSPCPAGWLAGLPVSAPYFGFSRSKPQSLKQGVQSGKKLIVTKRKFIVVFDY